MEEIKIKTETIKLDQFLKWANIVSTGGEAKALIQSGGVRVNNKIEKRRGLKLKDGDLVNVEGLDETLKVSG
ncbi:MAG TPA: RNA-binding S4 domain-containing protein [Halanaerobiales bacterium]|nr:RNA-binding S4 domain-containing protein [Halanaerobiales bacterium]